VEKRVLAGRSWEYRILAVRPLTGLGPAGAALGLLHLPLSVARASRLLARFRPHVVLGLGGYCSGPVALAAWLRGIPVVLHEQNLVPGLANRLAGRFARTVCTGFQGVPRGLPARKVVFTGNPVRPSLLRARESRRPHPVPHLLVMGGSQGARGINRLVTAALPMLVQEGLELEVLHQTGAADIEEVRAKYASNSIAAEVVPFIDDMARAYGWADLAVCRAGAGTIAELTALGVAALLVPFPAAAGNHQEKNARALEAAGAAVVCIEEETGAVRFAGLLRELLSQPGRLEAMGRNARRLGRPNAAEEVARIVVESARRG